MSAVDPELLSAFAVFAEHLNFTRAAAELRLSQPALHVKVRRLGEALNRPLYIRHGRGLVLTPAGEAVARFAREHDARLAAFLAGLGDTQPRLPVVLAAGAGAYLYVLGDAVRRTVADGTRLRLLTGGREPTLAAVRTGRAHLGVAVLDVLPDDLVSVAVAAYPQVLVVPRGHSLARRRRLAVADLAGLDLVVPPPQRPQRIALERALRSAGVGWSVAVEAEGWPLILQFVRLGVGAAVVNGCVPPPTGLVARPVRDLPWVPYYAVHRPEATDDPRVAALLARITAAAGP